MMVRAFFVLAFVLVLASAGAAEAQRLCEYYVPPSGNAYKVELHPAYVTDFDFGEKLSPTVVLSDLKGKDYTVDFKQSMTGLSVHPENPKAQAANFNAETASGKIKVSVALETVTDPKDACTRVIFRAVSEAEAFRRAVGAKVKEETAKLQARVDELERETDTRVRTLIDQRIAERALLRHDLVRLAAVDRGDNDVVVRVGEALVLGDDALLFFQIQNRGRAAYRLATVQVLADGKDFAVTAQLSSSRIVEPGTLGVVAPGDAVVEGVAIVRQATKLRGRPLALVTAEPGDKGKVSVGGIVLR